MHGVDDAQGLRHIGCRRDREPALSKDRLRFALRIPAITDNEHERGEPIAIMRPSSASWSLSPIRCAASF